MLISPSTNPFADADPHDISLAAGDGSLRKPLADTLKSLLGDDGMITGRTDALEARMDRLETDRLALDRRMEKVEANYLRQFTALDTMVAQMSSVSSFLTQQLAMLPNYSQSS